MHRRERTSKLVSEYGHLPSRMIDDDHVAAWIKGGRNLGTVQHLRTFFNDAATVQVDVAVHEGMRPGELDALRWDRIDFQAGTILID